jgi:DNA-binding XRE family transcriptional regulator
VKALLKAYKPEFVSAPDDDLPARLRRRRRRLALSVEEAALLVGVRRWTWGLWENGGQRPQPRHQAALARFLAGGL